MCIEIDVYAGSYSAEVQRDTGRDFDCSQRCKSVAHISDWRIAVGLASDASATACVRRRCQVYLSYYST